MDMLSYKEDFRYKNDIQYANRITHKKGFVKEDSEYFVMFRRAHFSSRLPEQKDGDTQDCALIMDRDEAIKHQWIWPDGLRHWAVAPDEEKSSTFLWEFKTYEQAELFYDMIKAQEVGVNVRAR